MTQVPLILVHEALRNVPRHSPSGGPVTRHSPPPPWLGKLRHAAHTYVNTHMMRNGHNHMHDHNKHTMGQ